MGNNLYFSQKGRGSSLVGQLFTLPLLKLAIIVTVSELSYFGPCGGLTGESPSAFNHIFGGLHFPWVGRQHDFIILFWRFCPLTITGAQHNFYSQLFL